MRELISKLGYSKIAILFSLFFVYSAILLNQKWKSNDIISNDMIFYYNYLPATFIYHDITFSYLKNKLPDDIRRYSGALKTEDKKHYLSKMSCGAAIMLSPFFLTAKYLEIIADHVPNGYSSTFSFFICLATFFYLTIGLIFLRKVLLCFFEEATSAIVLTCLVLGTNIFMYSTYSFSNIHIYSFCLYSIFLWFSIQWHSKPTLKHSIYLGLILALIILVRPTDALIVIFPILYGIKDSSSLKIQLRMVGDNKINVILIILFLLIGLSPQLIIWKIQTGHWVYYSYQEQKLFLNNPHILKGLFSFRNGFFIYTPIMVFAVLGFIPTILRQSKFALSATIFVIINAYIIFSWWCWWYGGSYGMRAMIESYAVLALPFGIFIESVSKTNNLSKYFLFSVFSLMILLNLFQTRQSMSNLIHYDSMTYKTYKKIWGRLSIPDGYMETLSPPDYKNAVKGLPERDMTRTFPFMRDGLRSKVSIKSFDGKYVSTDSTKSLMLIANRDSMKTWEKFNITMYEFGKCDILAFNGKYVSSDPTFPSILFGNRDASSYWEEFSIINLPNNKFALKGYNGKFVKPNPDNDYILQAISDSLTEQETFIINPE